MSETLPVTVVISRRPAPGHEAELVTWAHGIRDAAAEFPGHVAGDIYPPHAPDRDDLVMAFTFADAASLQSWEHSDVRHDWLRRAEGLMIGEARTHAASGFESLFGSPGKPVIPPPRWKTALIIAAALYPVSLLLNWLLMPQLTTWPVWLRVALSTAIIVPWMTWLGVPYLSKWLRRWLHARSG